MSDDRESCMGALFQRVKDKVSVMVTREGLGYMWGKKKFKRSCTRMVIKVVCMYTSKI